MPYPTRPQNPNGYQILGQALTQGSSQVQDAMDRQAKMRADLQAMILRRQQAAMEQRKMEQEAEFQRQENERKAKEAETKQKEADRMTKAVKDFQDYSLGEKKLIQDAQQKPYFAPGMGPNGEAAQEIPAQYETVQPTREQLQQRALQTGAYENPGVKAYFDDTKPTRAYTTPEENLELYRAKREIDAAIASGRPLSPYQKMMMDVYRDRIEAGEEGRGLQREKLDRERENQGASRKTNFVKNTNDLKTEIDMFGKLNTAIPGGIYGEGGISGFGFGTAPLRKLWKSEEANAIRPTLQFLINAILKRQSGAAVSDQEFDRLNTAFGINTTGTIEEFRLGLQNYYEATKGQYDRFVKADPVSAGAIDAADRNLNPNAPTPTSGAQEWIRDPQTGKLRPK